MTKALIPLFMALPLAACQTTPSASIAPPATVVAEASGWRGEADPVDEVRIGGLRAGWQRALDHAAKAGFRKRVSAEGRLLDPEAALPFPAPSPGSYSCRTIRLGPATRGTPAFVAYKEFFCFVGVDEDRLFLAKQTGTERPSGYIWKGDDEKALVFLGSMARDEAAAVPYGSDRRRDLAGVLERIGPLRFRLVIPRDVDEGRLDILELVPAPVQNDE